MSHTRIKTEVANYYTEKLEHFGKTPQGVDWNSMESQHLRFDNLMRVVWGSEPAFSLLDYGCGYGAMYEYLKAHYPDMAFIGLDIAPKMVEEAIQKYGQHDRLSWYTQIPKGKEADYVVASGIFNVRLSSNKEEWEAYLLNTLHEFDKLSTKGFAFNVLTTYSDPPYMKDYLYYADPAFLLDYCKKHFSRYVAILHDYPLYEFTVTVKKLPL